MAGKDNQVPELTFLRHLPLAQEAVELAVELHAGQRRDSDGASFVMHPMEVASLLDRSHYPDHVVQHGGRDDEVGVVRAVQQRRDLHRVHHERRAVGVAELARVELDCELDRRLRERQMPQEGQLGDVSVLTGHASNASPRSLFAPSRR